MEGGAWGIVIVISAFMIQVLSFGTSAAIGVYNIELLDYFEGETLGVSLIGSINLGVNLGSGPIVSFLMTKYSYRKIALCGSILVSVGLLAMPFLSYIPAMCLFYGVLTGFGNCCVYIPSHVLSGLYYDKYRSLATGVSTSGSGLGGAVVPVMAGFLIGKFSWKGSLVVIAGLNFHLFIFSALLHPPSRPKPPPWDQNTLGLTTTPPVVDAGEAIAMQVIVHECRGITRVEDDDGHNFWGLDSSELDFIDKVSHPASFSSTETLISTRIHKYGTFSRRPKSWMSCIGDEEAPLSCIIKSPSSGTRVPRSTSDTYKLALQPASMGWRGSSCVFVESLEDVSIPASASANETDPVDLNSQDTVPYLSRHVYIFTNYGFDIYFLSNVMWNAGYAIIQTFAPEFLRERGLTPMETAWLSGAFGFGAFIGGILGGVLGNVKGVNRQFFYTLANVAMGGLILVLPYSDKKLMYVFILLSSGFSWGIILGLLLVVLTDLIGIENLGNGLGYLMLSNGLGTIAGPPMASLLQNDTDGFGTSILLAGAVCILGGLVMLLMPCGQCHDANVCTGATSQDTTSSKSDNEGPIASV